MNVIQHIKNFKSKKPITFVGKISGVLFLLFGLAFASCSHDSYHEEEPELNDQEYYIALNVTIPTDASTRSFTEENGSSNNNTIGGKKKECNLSSAELFFCIENEVILKLTANEWKLNNTAPEGSDKQYVLSARVEDLQDLAGMVENKEGKDIQLFVVGNFTNHDFSEGGKDADEAVYTWTGLGIAPLEDFGDDGEGQLMPLVNAQEFKPAGINGISGSSEDILESIKGLFNAISSVTGEKNTYNMGTVDLERAVARIDFGDKKDRTTSDVTTPWVYKIGDKSDLKVKLYSLQMFNVNKKSYLFRHTAEGTTEGITADKASLFGTERGTGEGYIWIAGNDWVFSNESVAKNGTIFSNPLVPGSEELPPCINADPNDCGMITVSRLSAAENKRGYVDSESNRTYYSWCYVSENTLPGVSLMSGDNVGNYATGLSFRFQVLGSDGNELTLEDVNSNQNLPSGITVMEPETESVDDDEENEDGEDQVYPAIKITDSDGSWVKVDYDAKAGGYFITYYNYIIHNDSFDGCSAPNIPMYYGVVRNNVYQLSVKSIAGLPHPEKPESYYLAIDIKVLAWAKHDIHVTF